MIKLDNLAVSYRGHPALHPVSGHFPAGSLTAVYGPNGSGKSTLLKGIAGLVPNAGGRVDGTMTVSDCDRRIAYLPQVNEIDRNFPLNVRDCVMLGLWSRVGPWGAVNTDDRIRIERALDAVGLGGFEHRTVGSLSSGQFQRVLFARLMMQDAHLILLDEPFNAVDAATTTTLLGVVAQWHSRGATVIAVLHDDRQVRNYFPQTLILAREIVAWGDTATVLTRTNIQRAHAMARTWEGDAVVCNPHCREKNPHTTPGRRPWQTV